MKKRCTWTLTLTLVGMLFFSCQKEDEVLLQTKKLNLAYKAKPKVNLVVSNINGQVSSGTSNDLDKYRKLYNFVAASGKSPSDIVGMGIAGSNDHCYVWYKDGTVSSGTSNDLDKYRPSYNYTLAPGKSPSDIAGMGIAGSNDHCYVWYKDGTVSSGTSNDLDKYRPSYNYTLAFGKSSSNIVGMGIAGSNDHCYMWYK